MKLIKEDFKKFKLTELPYDKGHTALGEYHYYYPEGYFGDWYDPICLHQWRTLDGSWLITSDGNKRFLEQNRGDNCTGAYKNVYCCLVNKNKIYADYQIEFDLRILELNNYCGVAFNYQTSRKYDFIGLNSKGLGVFHRDEEEFIFYKIIDFDVDVFHTYHFKIKVGNNVEVYLDDVNITNIDIKILNGSKVALSAKSICRYSDFIVEMSEENYKKHLKLEEKESTRIKEKRSKLPELKLIKKINLDNFGSGRQLRISRVDGKTIFLIAQHQKRVARDSYAHISCLTCFDEDGKVLWQKGEPNNTDNILISCDLPFQIADMNNDGRLEVIYSVDFEVFICDLLTGKILKKMKTPIVYEPFYHLNVDAIRVADFSGVGYKRDFIVKDRYHNVWAYNHNMEFLWKYNHKNTGHFPYIFDFDEDGKDEMFVGYDLVDDDGKIIFSLPMNSDHTDEIIYASLCEGEPKRLILASGNEGMNICNIDGTVYKHNEVGHSQRISIAKYRNDIEGLQIMSTTFWGGNGIIGIYDCHGNLLKNIEQMSNGNIISPLNYDGEHILALLHSGVDGGLIDGQLDKVVIFPDDDHPTLCCEVYDIDDDGIDEIICYDNKELWIYKASEFKLGKRFEKYPDDSFSNYRGEYLLPKN